MKYLNNQEAQHINIKKAAVIGSGTMGAQIALHFANIGLDVLLLDIVPKELNDKEKAKGLTLADKEVRNRIVTENLAKAIKLKPAPLYKEAFKTRIKTGNLEDDLDKLSDTDLILEAVLEKLEIKQSIFEKVDKHRKAGSIVTSNTSGIPIHDLIQGRSEDFAAHFCGTHFFNPPRYLPLLEIIPSQKTGKTVVEALKIFADKRLGKTVVIAKDEPAFVANRIGVYSIMLTIQLMQDLDLSVEEIDKITGKPIGRPKSATFRTCDLVGIDILADVTKGIYEKCKDDEEREIFHVPEFMQKMVQNGWVGEKGGQGFYKKIKDKKGESEILAIDINTLEYHPSKDPDFLILEELKSKKKTEEKLEAFEEGEINTVSFLKKFYLGITGADSDKAVTFFRQFHHRLFAYCSHRIPEISDEIYKIDLAIKAGFAWEFGPFEVWDILGVEYILNKMETEGHKPAKWVYEMLQKGITSFYKTEKNRRLYYDIETGNYKIIPGTEDVISIDNFRETNTIWHNKGCNIIDIGDGVLNIEFTTKSNTINVAVIEGLYKAVELAENNYKGLVIGNKGDDFCLGADLSMIGMNAYLGKLNVVDEAVKQFQDLMLRIRYSSIPVVAAPFGKTLGGGAEICLQVDAVQAAAETYIGLVEVAVGLIPAGGGTKEFTKRAAEEFMEDEVNVPRLQERVMTIAQAKVATSAEEAFELGFFRKGIDHITMNKSRLITDAKKRVLELWDKGYSPPQKAKIKVLGRNVLSFFYSAINNMQKGHYITEYDQEIANKLAYIMCGGDLSEETDVSEQYLLNLERKTFVELINDLRTLKRMQHILKTGKPLRN